MNAQMSQFLNDPGRLERELTGPHLAELVAELGGSLPAQTTTCGSAVRAVLGQHQVQILEYGLGRLPRAVLARLLERPELLLDLQRLVCCEGGPYWDDVLCWHAGAAQSDAAVLQELQQFFTWQPLGIPGAQTLQKVEKRPNKAHLTGRQKRWWALLTTGTALVLGVIVGAVAVAQFPRWAATPGESVVAAAPSTVPAVELPRGGQSPFPTSENLTSATLVQVGDGRPDLHSYSLFTLHPQNVEPGAGALPPDEGTVSPVEKRLVALLRAAALLSEPAAPESVQALLEVIRNDEPALRELTRNPGHYQEHPEAVIRTGATRILGGLFKDSSPQQP